MAIVQFRVDDELKKQASAVYERLGIDLSTALRMFMKRSVLENGIPFTMLLSDDPFNGKKTRELMREAKQIMEEVDKAKAEKAKNQAKQNKK